MLSLSHQNRPYDPKRDEDAELRACLDPHETSERPRPPPPTPQGSTANTDAETTFRHSGWLVRRRCTADALAATGSTPATLHRFENCGAAAWIMQDVADPNRCRIQCERCRSRWCEACGRERRSLVQMNLSKNLPKARLRFLTLTLKSNDDAPGDAIKRLYACFRKLRNRSKIKPHIRGGIAFLELTYSPERRQFHPHLHVIFEGDYINFKLLRQEWLSVTGDSFIIDIRPIHRPEVAIGYVAKYASKAIGSSIWRDPTAFAEVIRGMQGVRTLFTFGTWKGFKLLKAPESDTEWKTLGRLDDIVKRAATGDAEASQILRALGRYIPADEHATGTLFSDDG